MLKHLIICLFFISAQCGFAGVRIVPVKPSAEPETADTTIVFPRPYENKRTAPVSVQLRVEGFPLGVMTQGDRAHEVRNSPRGQSVHVIVDDMPYQSYNQSFEDSFYENREYYDKILSFSINRGLKSGQHVIRAFQVRSYGESLKGSGPFTATVFYFQDSKKCNTLNVDLNEPYLTYNEPQGDYFIDESMPILLDFLISNCELSQDGFKVRLSIDGTVVQLLTQYVPYYMYDLGAGKHQIKLELVDKTNQLVPGFFNEIEREIEINYTCVEESH